MPSAGGAWNSTGGAWGSGGGGDSYGAPVQADMGGGGGGHSNGQSRKEADLNKREAELNRREAELRRLELEIRNNPGAKSTKNWPKFCPVLHHDIAGEIPAQSQVPVRRAYWAYLVRRARQRGEGAACAALPEHGALRHARHVQVVPQNLSKAALSLCGKGRIGW